MHGRMAFGGGYHLMCKNGYLIERVSNVERVGWRLS